MATLVIASGFFNPLGKHHLAYLESAKELGDVLVVIINNDEQVKLKNSIPFQNRVERLWIVNSLKVVNNCIYSIDNDDSVAKSIEQVIHLYADGMPDSVIFANGGDRTEPNLKEKEICDRYGIEMKFGVGGRKTGASSDILDRVGQEWVKRKGYYFECDYEAFELGWNSIKNKTPEQYDSFMKRSK